MKSTMYKNVILANVILLVSIVGVILLSCNAIVDSSDSDGDGGNADINTIYPVESVLTSVDANTLTVTWELPLNRSSIDHILITLNEDVGTDIAEHVQTVKLERTITEYSFSLSEGDYLVSITTVAAETSKVFTISSPVTVTTGATPALAVNPGYNTYTGAIETFSAGDSSLVEIEVVAPADTGLETDGVTAATLVSYTLYWKKSTQANVAITTNLYDYDGFSVITQTQVVNGMRLQANFLENNSKYLFQLVTKNSANISSFSDVFDIITQDGTEERAPSAPVISSVESIGAQLPRVRLMWNAPADVGKKLVGGTVEDAIITRYIVYWEEVTEETPVATVQSENQKEVLVVNDERSADFDQANDGLDFGKEYSFIVVAVNDATTKSNDQNVVDKVGIHSAPSGSVTVTTVDLSEPPQAIQNMVQDTTYNQPTRIKLNWDAVTSLGKMSDGTDATGIEYRVRYIASAASTLQEIIDDGQVSESTTNTTFTVTGMIPETLYRVVVEAVNTSPDKTSYRYSYSDILDITSGDFATFTFTASNTTQTFNNVVNALDDTLTVSVTAGTITIATLVNIIDANTPPEIQWMSTDTNVVHEFVENSRNVSGNNTVVNVTATLKEIGTTVLRVTFDNMQLFAQGFTLIVTE